MLSLTHHRQKAGIDIEKVTTDSKQLAEVTPPHKIVTDVESIYILELLLFTTFVGFPSDLVLASGSIQPHILVQSHKPSTMQISRTYLGSVLGFASGQVKCDVERWA